MFHRWLREAAFPAHSLFVKTDGTLWAMGVLGFVGEEINTLNNIMPALVLVVGFTDSVHLMVDIRRHRRAGSSSQQAAAAALRHR